MVSNFSTDASSGGNPKSHVLWCCREGSAFKCWNLDSNPSWVLVTSANHPFFSLIILPHRVVEDKMGEDNHMCQCHPKLFKVGIYIDIYTGVCIYIYWFNI